MRTVPPNDADQAEHRPRHRRTDARAAHRARKRDARRTLDEIRQAAIEEFGKNGYGRSSVARIARDARVSKQLVYHYYPRKEELYADVVNSFAHDYFTGLLAIDYDDPDPAKAVEQFADRIAGFYIRHPALTGLVVDQSLHQGSTFKGTVEVLRLRGQLLGQLERALARGAATGVFDARFSAEGGFLMAVAIAVGYSAIGRIEPALSLPARQSRSDSELKDWVVGLVMKCLRA